MRFQAFHIMLVIMVSISTASANTANDPLAQIRRLYDKQANYGQCLLVLEPLVKGEERNNPEALLYYGLTLEKLGRFSEAKAELNDLLIRFPFGMLATQAKQAIDEMESGPISIKSTNDKGGIIGDIGIFLNGTVVTRVLDNSPALLGGIECGDKLISANNKMLNSLGRKEMYLLLRGVVGSPVSLVVERDRQQYSLIVERAAPFTSANGLPEYRPKISENLEASPDTLTKLKSTEPYADMVSIHKQGKDTQYVHTLVLEALKLLPTKLKAELAESGWKIKIVPSTLELYPATGGTQVYKEGGGPDNMSGWCDPVTKTVYICERRSLLNSPPMLNSNGLYITLHELGHAFDALKGISKTEEFRTAYVTEVTNLTNQQRKQFSYYVQIDGGGELVADFFSNIIKPGGSPHREVRAMPKALPHCYELVEKSLSDNR
jgi:hypothetical protein